MTGASLRLNPGDKSYRAILSRSAVCSSVFLQNGIWDFFQFCLVNTFSIIRNRVKAGLSAVEKNSYCRRRELCTLILKWAFNHVVHKAPRSWSTNWHFKFFLISKSNLLKIYRVCLSMFILRNKIWEFSEFWIRTWHLSRKKIEWFGHNLHEVQRYWLKSWHLKLFLVIWSCLG